MRKRLGQTEDDAKASSSQLHPEDELYAVPADLQVITDLGLQKDTAPIIVHGTLSLYHPAVNIHKLSCTWRQHIACQTLASQALDTGMPG